MFIRGSLEASNCGKTAAEEKHRSRLESEIDFCCGMFFWASRQTLGSSTKWQNAFIKTYQ
jgi:hypothetical protein